MFIHTRVLYIKVTVRFSNSFSQINCKFLQLSLCEVEDMLPNEFSQDESVIRTTSRFSEHLETWRKFHLPFFPFFSFFSVFTKIRNLLIAKAPNLMKCYYLSECLKRMLTITKTHLPETSGNPLIPILYQLAFSHLMDDLWVII